MHMKKQQLIWPRRESNKVRECLDCGHRIYNKKGQQEPYKVRRENIPIVRDLSMRDYKQGL